MIATPESCKDGRRKGNLRLGGPAHTLFKKGEVHNPHGRPKRQNCFSDIAREMMSARKIDISLTLPDGKTKHIGISSSSTMRHGIVAAMIREAFAGNINAAKELIDRTDGKVSDKLILDDSVPRTITIRVVKPKPQDSPEATDAGSRT